MPLVSVVIPSRDAGEDLYRAIASVRAQTLQPVEVVVVLDNAAPSEQVLARLKRAADRVVQTPGQAGGGRARNLGIAAASGKWIALLDDDDSWAETKLEKQLEKATQLREFAYPVISTRVAVRQGEEERIWPLKRAPTHNSLRLSEYLFCISGPTRRGEGFVQTSTLFASRELFQAVPFTQGLKIHQDWDWLLRAATQDGFHLEILWEPLTIYNLNPKGNSVSQSTDWRPSFAWATGNPLISRKAYSYFLATVVARYLSPASLPKVLWAFLTRSRVDARSAFLFVVFFSFRNSYRVRAAKWLRRLRTASVS